jgi:predicted O-methyltransferase YrrM
MDLNDYLLNNNVPIVEGFTKQIPWQIDDLKLLSKNAKTIMEIGFNAGHSSELFLESSTDTKIVSFDLGFYNYVSVGKEYIDNKFPERHTLILGDSRITVPKYIQDNPEMKFDFIFIDGGHEYPIASADILNCRALANKDTIVVLNKIDLLDNNSEPKTNKKAVLVSAQSGLGLNNLLNEIKEYVQNFFYTTDAPLITRQRHRENLERCKACLEVFNLQKDIELAAEDLRLASRYLSVITGKIDVESVLGEIFSNFCIGK